MACYNHPDKEAIATCNVCGKPICSDCYVEIGGNAYCKNCINALLTAKVSEDAKNQEQTIENIEPITKPKTIPYEEESAAPEEIIEPVAKAPENYQPEYDYETEYVETYGDGDSEDSYYENPETIPEPEPEYKKKMVADPIIPEKPKTQEEIEPQQVENNIESKYERYLEDLYYDEEPVYNRQANNQYYEEPVYNNRNNQYYEEPIYVDRQNAYANEPVYQERYIDDDLDYIVPVHQAGNRNNGPSYEDIKRRIEAERNYNQGHGRGYYEDDYGYDRRMNPNQNLGDIQRMHSYEQKQDNSFTTGELILTIILIVLIIIVAFYVIYLFALSSTYPTVMDAINGLVQNPGLFLTNLIHQ